MLTKSEGLTPRMIHVRQRLKFALLWGYYPISFIFVLVTTPKEWMFTGLLLASFLAPFVLYYLFVFLQPKAVIKFERASSSSARSAISIRSIESLVLKRAVYRSHKLFSFTRGKPLFIVIDMLTIVSNMPDRNIGVLRALTDEESVAFEKTILQDNSVLYTEYFPRFPAPETILLEEKEFMDLCDTLTNESGKSIVKLSGGNTR